MNTVVITGANRGLGLELVKVFSKDSLVYAVCRNAASFPSSEMSKNIEVVSLDITNDMAVINFVDEINFPRPYGRGISLLQTN